MSLILVSIKFLCFIRTFSESNDFAYSPESIIFMKIMHCDLIKDYSNKSFKWSHSPLLCFISLGFDEYWIISLWYKKNTWPAPSLGNFKKIVGIFIPVQFKVSIISDIKYSFKCIIGNKKSEFLVQRAIYYKCPLF